MKKIIFAALFSLLVIGASVQTYASTVLDSNIISLIESGISNIVNSVNPPNENVISTDNSSFNSGDYIDQKNNQLNNDLTDYKNQQVADANQQLSNYIDEIKQEIDTVYQSKEDKAKHDIDNKINDSVTQLKQKILDELTKELNHHH